MKVKYRSLFVLAPIFMHLTSASAEPIISSTSTIVQADFDYWGSEYRFWKIDQNTILDDSNSETKLTNQYANPANFLSYDEFLQAYKMTSDQTARTNASDGTIKLDSQSDSTLESYPILGEGLRVPETRITEVASSLSFEGLQLDVFEDAETTFEWNVDGFLDGIAGYGAAVDVTLTNIETGNIQSNSVTKMRTSLIYKDVEDFYDYNLVDVYFDDTISSTFSLEQGSYSLDIDLNLTAISIAGRVNNFSYEYKGTVYDLIDELPTNAYESEKSRANLSHTATFGITSPSMQNLALHTGSFSQILTPQIEEIAMAGGGPNSVNADNSGESTDNDNAIIAVPEPSSLGLIAVSLLALRVRRR